jgi:outer membrane protein assembly factor BamB
VARFAVRSLTVPDTSGIVGSPTTTGREMLSCVRPVALAVLVMVSKVGAQMANSAPADVSLMFRGAPAHTGVATGWLFNGQGGVRWRFQTRSAVRSTPAVTATRVFVGSGDSTLYALDRASGKPVWAFAAGGPVHSSPAVADGLVIAATLAGRIFAVSEATGELRWSMQTGSTLPKNISPAGEWDLYVSSPVVVDRTIVIGAGDGNVYALDLTTGRERWRAKTGGKVRATPSVKDGVAVVGSWDGRVYAIDVATGNTRWVHHTVGDTLDLQREGYDRRAIQSTAAIAEGTVFLGSRDDGFYALDFATGQRKWRSSHATSWVVGSPAVRDGRAYVGSSDGHFIQSVDVASGRELWRAPVNSNVLSSPVLAGSLLVVGAANTNAGRGEVLALDAPTGVVRWRLPLGDAVWSTPVVVGNEIYIGCDDGGVVAIEEVNASIPRLAVYYDSTVAGRPFVGGGRLAFEYFRGVGYEPLDVESLARFLAARIADGVPSVVVFATDVLPNAIAPAAPDTILLRRYLNAGGKVVWLGEPIGALVRDSTGRPLGMNPRRTEKLIGVPMGTMEFDHNVAYPTELGRRWGIDRFFRGDFPIAVSDTIQPLAIDELGKTSAWVRVYRPDRPGSGFVQLWGLGAAADRLPLVRAAAEYGLLRRATVSRGPGRLSFRAEPRSGGVEESRSSR